MIKFDLKGNKLIFRCDDELFKQVREQFSYPYVGHSFMKKRISLYRAVSML